MSMQQKAGAGGATMIRKQFFIDRAQSRRLKARAVELGVSEAELVRQGIERVLDEAEDRSVHAWKAGLAATAGVLADNDSIEGVIKDNRSRWMRRLDAIRKTLDED